MATQDPILHNPTAVGSHKTGGRQNVAQPSIKKMREKLNLARSKM